MEQRPLRLGDIVDDYCPRERRITNHVIVALIDDRIRQTRCTTCESEHVYKEARVPRRRKKDEAGELVLCENVRFNVGEEADDEGLAKRMAALCDVFVMDAFGTAHRAQASTNGVARHAPVPVVCMITTAPGPPRP